MYAIYAHKQNVTLDCVIYRKHVYSNQLSFKQFAAYLVTDIEISSRFEFK